MKIFDPIHKFIFLSAIEEQVVTSSFFQRLRSIHQMGVAYFVFPGATNRRYDHSLGVMALASTMFSTLTETVGKEEERLLPQLKDPAFISYWHQVLRCAALCHDMGHLPFSHAAESVLLSEHGHEEWTYKAIYSTELKAVWSRASTYPGQCFADDVAKVALGRKAMAAFAPDVAWNSWEEALATVITGDDFGADRIDYLLRDAYFTGMTYGYIDYHQLVQSVRLLAVDGELVLGLDSNGMQAVESLLLARHFMHARVYRHPKCMVYTHHLAQFMRSFAKQYNLLDGIEHYFSVRDDHVVVAWGQDQGSHAKALTDVRERYRYIYIAEKEGVVAFADKLVEEYGEAFGYSSITLTPPRITLSDGVYCRNRQGKVVSGKEYYTSFLWNEVENRRSLLCFCAPSLEGELCQRIQEGGFVAF